MPVLKTLKSMPLLCPLEGSKTSSHPKVKEQPVPVDIPKRSTRHISRPCCCGRFKPGCYFDVYFVGTNIIAIHKKTPWNTLLDRETCKTLMSPRAQTERKMISSPSQLTEAQTNAVLYYNSNTTTHPTFTIYKTFAQPPRKTAAHGAFLRDEPFLQRDGDDAMCCVCKEVMAYEPAVWVKHRDACCGIENRILRAVTDVWAVGVANGAKSNGQGRSIDI